MMNTEESNLFAAVCAGRDKLSERFDRMTDSRNWWRGFALVMVALAALNIVSEWAGWSL